MFINEQSLKSLLELSSRQLDTFLNFGELLPDTGPPLNQWFGQFWMRRFRAQAASLCAALSALTDPAPALDFVARALTMLHTVSWIPAHRFLLAELRQHLLGWPDGLAPHGRRVAMHPAVAPA